MSRQVSETVLDNRHHLFPEVGEVLALIARSRGGGRQAAWLGRVAGGDVMSGLRVGLAGAGFVSSYHLRGWRRTGRATVEGICALDEGQAHRRAEEFEVPAVYSSVTEMLDNAELDVLDIVAPPAAHLPLVTAAAERGVHVLCQKPLAADLGEARQIAAVAERAGISFMVHENWRFRSWYRALAQVLRGSQLGRVFHARLSSRFAGTVLTRQHPDVPYSLDRQPFLATMPRFLVFESAIHQLDVVRYLFGEPRSLYARVHRVSEHVVGEDTALVVLGYPEMTVIVERSYASKGYRSPPVLSETVAVEGTAGTAFVGEDGRLEVIVDRPQGRDTRLVHEPGGDPYADSYAAAIAHFVDGLVTGRFETGAQDNLRTLGLVFAAYHSAETGQALTGDALAALTAATASR